MRCLDLILDKKACKYRQQDQKSEIESGKPKQIRAGSSGVMCGVFAKGDQAGKRCDQGARAADVYAQKECGIVGRKLGEENGRGDVADDLTGERTDQESVLFQQTGKQIADRGNTRHIAREDKKADKCQQQGVIHSLECLAIHKQKHQRNDDQADLIGDHTKDDHNGECKERKVDQGALGVQSIGTLLSNGKALFGQKQTANGDQCDRSQKRDQHDGHKLARGNVEFGIEKQILRIAERGQHSAEICGNVLHDEYKCHVALLAGGGQYKITQRQKGQKCHVVCDQHGSDKGDIHQGKHRNSQISRAVYDLTCKNGKEFNILQGTYNRQHTKQAGQRFPIKIVEILRIHRYDAGGDERRCHGYGQHNVFTQPMQNSKKCLLPMQMVVGAAHRMLIGHEKKPSFIVEWFKPQYYTTFFGNCQGLL